MCHETYGSSLGLIGRSTYTMPIMQQYCSPALQVCYFGKCLLVIEVIFFKDDKQDFDVTLTTLHIVQFIGECWMYTVKPLYFAALRFHL